MRFSKKVAFTLETSSIELDDTYDWDVATTYAKGDLVSYTETATGASYFYLSNHDANLGFTVDQYKHWTQVGPANQWAMFSEYFDSVSEFEDSGDLIVGLQIEGGVDTLTFTGVVASYINIEVYASEGGALVYANQVLVNDYLPPDTDLSVIADKATFYNLFYDYFDQTYTDPYILITFGRLSAYNCRCGKLAPGLSYYVGETQHRTSVKIDDFSSSSVDDFGVYELEVGPYAGAISAGVYVDDADLDEIIAKLKEVVASPCLWNFNNEDTNYSSLVVYGFPRVIDAKIGAPNATFIDFEVTTATSRFENTFFYIRITKISASVVGSTASYVVLDLPLIADFLDDSPNTKSVSVVGDVTINDTSCGEDAAYFDGSGDYLSVTYNTAFDLLENDFTIEAEVYRSSGITPKEFANVISHRVSLGSNNFAFTIDINSGDNIYVIFKNDVNTNTEFSVDFTPYLDKFTHIAVSRIGDTIYAAVDGVVKNSGTISGPVKVCTGNVKIGAFNQPVDSRSYFEGCIRNVKITNGISSYSYV